MTNVINSRSIACIVLLGGASAAIAQAQVVEAEAQRGTRSSLAALRPPQPELAQVKDDDLPAGAISRFGVKRAMHGIQSNIAFSPDGKYIAAVTYGGDVVMREAGDLSYVATYRCYRGCEAISFSPDGKILAIADKNMIRLVVVEDGEELGRLERFDEYVRALAFLPDGKRLITGDRSRLLLFNIESRKLLREAKIDSINSVHMLCLDSAGKRVAVANTSGKLRVWDIEAWKELFVSPEEALTWSETVFFHPDGKRVGIARPNEPVCLYDVATGRKSEAFAKVGGAAAVSVDSSLIAVAERTAGETEPIHVYELKTEKKLITLAGHREEVRQIALAPGNKVLVSFGRDNMLRKWDLTTGKEIGPIGGHQHEITGVAFIDGGKRIVSRSRDGTLRFWDAFTGKEQTQLATKNGARNALALSPDGRTLAWDESQPKRTLVDRSDELMVQQHRLAVMPLPAEKNGVRYLPHDAAVRHLAFAPDGRHLDVSSDNLLARIPIDDRKQPARDSVAAVRRTSPFRISPDGKYLIAHEVGGGWEFTHLLCRERATDKTIFERKELGWRFTAYAFSPTTSTIAIAGEFPTSTQDDSRSPIQIWRLADGQLVRPLEYSRRVPWLVQFSPDGRMLAAADDSGISLYETHTGLEFDRFRGHDGRVTCIDFSPDGKMLVTGSADTTLIVWDITGDILEKGRLPEKALDEAALLKAWEELASDEPAKARRALWRLVGAKETAAKFLAKRLDVASDADLNRMPQLMALLDSPQFKTRDQAVREIEMIGPSARPILEKAKSSDPSPEVREASERILKRIGVNEDAAVMSRLRRAVRVVEALERLDTADARQLLVRIEARGVFALQREEARLVLKRVESDKLFW